MKSKSRMQEETSKSPTDGFRLEDFLPYRLSVAAHGVGRMFARQAAEAFSLSIPEWRVLTMVGRFGTLSPSAVGERAAMDKVKVSRAAASLVARGMLKQSPDPNDGRGRLLSLTRKGSTVHQNMVPLARGLQDQLAEGLSRTEWSGLLKSLDKLTAHVEQLAGSEHVEAIN